MFIKFIKGITALVLLIISLQILTFLTFSDSQLIQSLGENYETYVLDIEENYFATVDVITTLDCSVEDIHEHFPAFRKYPVTVCDDENCIRSLKKKVDDYYIYWIRQDKTVPFLLYELTEGENGEEYGASWSSTYVWVLFKWVLIKKENTGIS